MVLRLLATLFPPFCIHCRAIDGPRSQPLCLCRRCRGLLRFADETRCVVCGRRAVVIGSKGQFCCFRCADRGEVVQLQLALWRYEPPLDSVIQGLKFKRMEFLGSQLAAALHQNFAEVLSEINVVVPIPLYWYRRLGRGFNQAESIAKPLARHIGAEFVTALRRRHSTRAQARLDRSERLHNLRSALTSTTRGQRSVAGRQVLLVDDVLTTGATLGAATRCLAKCNVKSVTTITVASTPRQQRSIMTQVVANVEDREFRGL